MRTLLALCLIAAPAFAQDAPAPAPAEEDGFSLMEEGAKLLMRGMMAEMEPALEGMEEALGKLETSVSDFGPKLVALLSMIDDIGNYDAPVKLPNGDILLRRTAPPAPVPETEPRPQGEIEL